MAIENWIGLLRESIYHAIHSPLLKRGNTPEISEEDECLGVTCQELGVELSADDDGKIDTIYFYSQGHQGYAGFQDELPRGLSFADCVSDVRGKVGEPTRSKGPTESEFLGWYPPWERIDGDNYCLHIEYADAERTAIRIITIMTPEAAP